MEHQEQGTRLLRLPEAAGRQDADGERAAGGAERL